MSLEEQKRYFQQANHYRHHNHCHSHSYPYRHQHTVSRLSNNCKNNIFSSLRTSRSYCSPFLNALLSLLNCLCNSPLTCNPNSHLSRPLISNSHRPTIFLRLPKLFFNSNRLFSLWQVSNHFRNQSTSYPLTLIIQPASTSL